MKTEQKANRLINEKSPYLLQHAHNLVEWYPWGDEAFAKAKAEDKPIFLSIGYSTCHWCHVMERESFEDPEVAEVLNEGFVSIKVDREERPDVDHLYMTVCQALTGHGGWPLTIIMTPEKKPFFAGTYFPKHSRRGMPGIMEILTRVRQIWVKEQSTLVQSGEEITQSLVQNYLVPVSGELLPQVIDRAYHGLGRYFDHVYGGFGSAPKFPTPHNLTFLLRYAKIKKEERALEMVEKTLEQMYKGGIFDHIGFGFSRYSTDRKWLVPHFEKMLYDNALLAIAYLEAYQVTGKPLYQEVVEKIFSYILRDMTSPEGGFYSAEDADSEGVEGKFYVWSPQEINEILGEEKGKRYAILMDITPQGNFEGKSIPNLIQHNLADLDEQTRQFLADCRIKLFEAREKRVHPHKDDKILTAWNALMIAALAIGARALDNKTYLVAAEKAISFIFEKLQRADGRLLARYRDGEAAYPAYVDDYAFLIWALLELYETTYQPSYLAKAVDLNKQMLDLFWDREAGGLYMYGQDSEQLLARPKEIYDGAMPSGNSVAAWNFLRLASLTADYILEERAQELFQAFGGTVKENPAGYTFLLQAYLFAAERTQEVIIVTGEETKEAREMVKILHHGFLPHTTSHLLTPQNRELIKTAPFLQEYQPAEGKTLAYVCEHFACHAPVSDASSLREALGLTVHD